MRDEAAQQEVYLCASLAEVSIEQDRFGRGDDGVVVAVQQEDRRRRRRRGVLRGRGGVGGEFDVRQEDGAERLDVAIVDVGQVGGRRLGQRFCHVARLGEHRVCL